ncbi:MAG: PHB depolymerase family esterase [Betaproteobacteria bacterium]
MSGMMPRNVLALAAVLAIAGASGADLTPGDYKFEMTHGERVRSYLVHVPSDTLVSPWPVVINLHGSGSSGAGQQNYSRMDLLADREGFVVVYPNGTGVLSEHLLTWNAGTCCGYGQSNEVDDVGFVRAMVDDLGTRLTIDRTRIYVTGLSNGAMLAYRLAVEAPDLIAAIAPVAGAMLPQPFAPRHPMSILHIHSVDDSRALFEGGLGPPYPLTTISVLHPAVQDVLRLWAEFDGCPGQPAIEAPIHGTGASAAHSAVRISYGPCRDEVEVVLWKLTGPGHVWPGGAAQYLSALLGSQSKTLGPATDVIDANERIWEFFSAHRLRQTAAPD